VSQRITATLAFGLAGCTYLLFLAAWYLTLTRHVALLAYLPWLGFICSGAVLGAIEPRRSASFGAILGFALTLLNALLNWCVAQFDSRLDVSDFQASIALGLFLLPIALALCYVGALVGCKIRSLARP
jgi:hypothetical protein